MRVGQPLRDRVGHPCARALAGALAIFLLGWVSCASQDPSAPPARLVILYATCTVNPNYLSPYNPAVRYTPQIDEFAAHSTVFTRHQSEAGQSGVAFASIFAGTQAFDHGVFVHPKKLPGSLLLVTEAYARGGYDVFSWLAHPGASAKLDYAQGVDPKQQYAFFFQGRDPRFQRILDRLESDPTYRAFVVVNFTVTHTPYAAPLLRTFCREYPDECSAAIYPREIAKYRAIFDPDNARELGFDFERVTAKLGLSETEIATLVEVVELFYKAEIFRLDWIFGGVIRMIESRGLLGDSQISFTADHGEVLFRENSFFYWSHAYQLAPEVLNVPLIIHAPRAGTEGRRYESVTRSIDVYPTLAGLSGVSTEGYAGPGVDLSEAMVSGKPGPPLLAFSHSSVVPHEVVKDLKDLGNLRALFPQRDPDLMWVSLRSGDTSFKLRRLGPGGFTPSVFDLNADPTESRDLYQPDDPEQQAMLARLERYRSGLVRSFDLWEGGTGEITSEAQAEMLRSLGYIK